MVCDEIPELHNFLFRKASCLLSPVAVLNKPKCLQKTGHKAWQNNISALLKVNLICSLYLILTVCIFVSLLGHFDWV